MNSEATQPPLTSDVFAAPTARDRQQSALFDDILEQARDLICERMDDAIGCMLDKADESLLALINEMDRGDDRRVHEDARDFVLKQRETIEGQFQECYSDDFQRCSDKARKRGERFGDADHTLDDLELVGKEDLDESLKFNDMANKLRAYCEDELVALDQRVGVLIGDANLQANDNPFSPQVICHAFKHACRHVDAEPGVRRVLLKLFDDHVLDDIRSIYKAVNALLVRHSILPKIRYGIARDPNRKPAAPGTPAAAEPAGESPPSELTHIAAQDLFAVLQRLASNQVSRAVEGQGGGGGAGAAPFGAQAITGAALPSGAQAVAAAGGVILQGAELLRSLTRIQQGDLSVIATGSLNASAADPGTTNVLHELKATSVGAGMGQLDLLTLDIIAMLFDQLFDDPKVPNGVKGIIGRLQIPMLKVAIADKSFFSTKAHPARRLLDAVGEIALRLPADFDTAHPLFAQLQSILQELVDGFQDNLEPFVAVRERLLALLAEEDRRIEEQAWSSEAKRIEEMESLAIARSAAEQEIRKRVQGQKLPLFIVDFLAQQWLKLLLLMHVKEGQEGASWKSALELMDRLTWSITPKATPEERSRLGKMVPKLVKDLTAGMKFAGTADSVREAFFGELMKYHTRAIGVAEAADAACAPAAQARSGAATDAARPASRPMSATQARNALDRSLDFSSPVTVKNPYGSGEVSVESQDLDFTENETANRARARREESIRRALDALGMGMWFEFSEPGNPDVRRPARLIFVSPRKTRYLFALDRAGKQIIQCTRAEIGRRLRLGEAVKLDKPPEESLFDRIMSKLLGKLGGPGRAAMLPA